MRTAAENIYIVCMRCILCFIETVQYNTQIS